MFNQSVELGLGFFIFVLSSGHSDSNLSGDISDSIAPDELVEPGVHSDIISLHLLGCELPDFTDSSLGLFLESDLMHSGEKVESDISAFFSHLLLVLFHHLIY